MLLAVTRLEHDLPWYFGVAVGAVWVVVVGLIVLLLVRWRQAKRARREQVRRAAQRARDDRSLGPGTDVEVW